MLTDYVEKANETYSKTKFEELTAREKEIMQLVVEGRTNSTIAKTLHISTKTVESHKKNLMRKLDVSHIPDLVKFAITIGLIEIDK